MANNSYHLTIVGLGSGDLDKLPIGVYRRLQQAKTRWTRTADHPLVEQLAEEGLMFHTMDDIYRDRSSFDDVYEAITERLLAFLQEAGELLYAVPGHPMVAEKTVQLLRARLTGDPAYTLEIIGGESFLDEAFLRFGFDPIEGFQLLDATAIQVNQISTNQHLLIGQVYDRMTAGEVKLCLMEWYPDDHMVWIGSDLGVANYEIIEMVLLHELDHAERFHNRSLIWVPACTDQMIQYKRFAKLEEIIAELRGPQGCPWDKAQTHQSLRKYLVEETYETLEAIDLDDPHALCGELGDVLLQVMLHAQIAAESGDFHIRDVVQGLNEKLVRRHPHVFGDLILQNAEEVKLSWERIKKSERENSGVEISSIMDAVPKNLPRIYESLKLLKKAKTAGIDDPLKWYNENRQGIEKTRDLGQRFFALVEESRQQGVDPEEQLALVNLEFRKKIANLEHKARLEGLSFDQTIDRDRLR